MIAQLVILLRLWRIVRVVNGIILSSKSQNDGALHQAKGEARKVIHMLHKTQKRLTEELVSSLLACLLPCTVPICGIYMGVTLLVWNTFIHETQ